MWRRSRESGGWERLVVGTLCTRLQQLKSKRVRSVKSQCDEEFYDALCWGRPWQKRRAALFVWQWWFRSVENDVSLRRSRERLLSFNMKGQKGWTIFLLASPVSWQLPSPTPSGMRNYLWLSETCKHLWQKVAQNWRQHMKHHPFSQKAVKGLSDVRARKGPQGCAPPWGSYPVTLKYWDRIILVMGKRLRACDDDGHTLLPLPSSWCGSD